MQEHCSPSSIPREEGGAHEGQDEESITKRDMSKMDGREQNGWERKYEGGVTTSTVVLHAHTRMLHRYSVLVVLTIELTSIDLAHKTI